SWVKVFRVQCIGKLQRAKMIIVLTGPNDFMRRTELNRLVDDFLKSHGEFGLERIDASEIEFGRLLENVSSTPFLTEKRMIILSNASANKALSEHIEQLLDSVSESTDLILDEQKFDKRLLLYKTLK